MAQIREELTLADKFSGTFDKFVSMISGALDKMHQYTSSMQDNESAALQMSDATQDLVNQLSGMEQAVSSAFTESQYDKALDNLIKKMQKVGLVWTSEGAELNEADLLMRNSLQSLAESGELAASSLAETAYAAKQAGAAERVESQSTNQAVRSQEKHVNVLQRAARGAKNLLRSALGLGKIRPTYNGLTKQMTRFALSIFSVTRIVNAVKTALERAPESISSSFETAGKNIKDLFGGAIVSMLEAMQPAIDRFNSFLESPEGAQFISSMSQAFSLLGQVAGFVVDLLISGAQMISDNWGTVAPILISLAIAIGASMVASAVASMAAWIAATWPLLLIIGIIALIIYVVHEAGVSFSEIFGGIGQTAGWLYALLYNLVADIWNVIAVFAEFFANVFNDPVGSIARLFFGVFDAILGVVETVAGAIDSLLGTDMAGAVSGFRADMQKWVDDTFGEAKIKIDRMEKIDYNDTMEQWGAAGSSFGKGLDDFELGEGGLFNSLGDIQSTLSDTSADTSAIKKSVSMSEEDLKSLVDMAERQYVNNINLTAQTPVINITGQNTGNADMDRRALANTIRDVLLEQAASASIRTTARVF